MNSEPQQPITNKKLTTTLPPNGLGRLNLGIYATEADSPKHSYSFTPERKDGVTFTETYLAVSGGVRKVAHFQNYEDSNVVVTAERAAD
ncbi:hypothetical protein [Streptomyces sp. NPDC094466]|uniref:hypothetical protein n=1 Tax=Streptomyces sp. NPDC094466 TaxID=3366065 RepID=UPI003823A0F5